MSPSGYTDRACPLARPAKEHGVTSSGYFYVARTRLVEAFVYIVSRDLRSPLVTVQGFARELGTSLDDPFNILATLPIPDATAAKVRLILEEDMPGALRYITAGTDKFERLINALLSLSRTGRSPLRMEPLDMDRVVEDTLGACARVS